METSGIAFYGPVVGAVESTDHATNKFSLEVSPTNMVKAVLGSPAFSSVLCDSVSITVPNIENLCSRGYPQRLHSSHSREMHSPSSQHSTQWNSPFRKVTYKEE